MLNVSHSAGSHFKNRQLAGLDIDSREFGLRALTDSQIQSLAPSAFAEGAHDSRSEKYTYIPSIQVIQAMRLEGFMPVAACQGKTRVPGKAAFTKHMIRFRKELDISSDSVDAVPEVCLINSHDGSSSGWLLGGGWRGACKNGLIVATSTVQGIKVSHTGNILEKFAQGMYETLSASTRAIEGAKAWARIELQPTEQIAFARAATQLRFDTNVQQIDPARIIAPQRRADTGSDLWTVFNRAQEHLLQGGDRYVSRTVNEAGRVNLRRQSSRAVTGIDQTVGLNTALWTLAEEMAKLKTA